MPDDYQTASMEGLEMCSVRLPSYLFISTHVLDDHPSRPALPLWAGPCTTNMTGPFSQLCHQRSKLSQRMKQVPCAVHFAHLCQYSIYTPLSLCVCQEHILNRSETGIKSLIPVPYVPSMFCWRCCNAFPWIELAEVP